jgi:DNA-binding transcriptional ArsR family regulator
LKEPLIIQILRLIEKEGPLSPEKIRQKLGVTSRTTVHPLISILRLLGLITYYVDDKGEKWQGIYVVTEYGKRCPTLKEVAKR